MKKIIALVLALVMTLSLLPMTVWATEGTVFSYNNVEFYTEYDSATGKLGYNDYGVEALSRTINGGGGTSVLVPYAPGLTSAIVYLKPAEGLALVLPSHRAEYSTLSEADSKGVYALTMNDLSRNTSVQVYNGEQVVGDIDFLFYSWEGNGNDSSGGGSSGNETELALYVGEQINDELSLSTTFRADINAEYGLWLFIDGESEPINVTGAYKCSYKGHIGSFSFVEGSGFKWNTTNATDSEGYLEVRHDDVPNTVYRMKATLNTGKNVFTHQSVDIYTNYTDGKLGYNAKDHGDITLGINGGGGVSVFASCDNSATSASVYLKPVATGYTLKLPSDRSGYSSLSKADGNGVYTLTLNDLSRNTSVQVYNGEQFVGDIDVMFSKQGGDQGGSSEQTIEYITKSGNSKIIVTVFEGVEEVIEFPKPGVLDGDTLTFTVKTADPDKWRPLLNRGNDAFWIPYTIVPINSPEGAVGNPKIAFNMGDRGLASVEQDLKDNIANATFYGYNEFPPAQNDSAQYAWDSGSSGGVITIIPKTQEVSRAWCWRYSGADETFSAPDQFDGVTVKVALGEGISDVISVKEIDYPAVEAKRISLVGPKKINEVLAFDEYENSIFTYKDGQDGVLTYTYVGEDTTNVADAIYAAAKEHGIKPDNSDVLHYDLLKVTAPTGYVAKEVKCSYYTQENGFNNNGSEVILRYHWRGLYDDLTFVVTWTDADTSDATVLEDKVEQVTIVMPNTEKKGPWMAYPMVNGVDHTATPVAKERLVFTALDGVQGVTEHKYNEETGVLFTTYNNQDIVDVSPILDATYSIKAPEGAVSFNVLMGGDGTDDPTYNIASEWKAQFFWENAVNGRVFSVSDSTIESVSINALLKQTYGEENEIEYYYSADEGTRYLLIRWNFENSEPLYEYLQLDTSNYFCQWKTAAVPTTSTDKTPVSKPTVVFDDEELELVTELVPQEMEGQYYYKMHLLKDGKVVTDYKGPYKIILPYCFMGRDEHGKDIWDWSKASKLKNAPVINHYNDLHKETEQITGKYTERGIEFEVRSFSPFMLTWDETVKENTGVTSGGYYPVVTPITPSVDVDNSSLNNAAQAVGSAINNGSAEVEVETGYTEADIAKLQKDGKLEMDIEKKSGYDAADKKLIDAAIAKVGGAVSGTTVQYFDITVVLKHEDTGAVVAAVSDTKKPITITVDLSTDLQKAAKDGKHIYVVRCHEGKTSFLETKLNADKTKVTFSSAYFSTYAVVAVDKKVSAQTFDAGIALYGAMAVLAATGSAVVIGKKHREK